MYLILDNLKMQRGNWFEPVFAIIPASTATRHLHCSWMNQLEQWFCILQRKRGVSATSLDLVHATERVMVTISQWHAHRHAFNWSVQAEVLVMAKRTSAAVHLLAA
jgi:hypothetical protein